jgi:hypothetical protein
LLNKENGHREALTIELGNLNYDELGANMMDLEGNEVDVPSAIRKCPNYIYLGDMKLLPIRKSYSIISLEANKRRYRYAIYK